MGLAIQLWQYVLCATGNAVCLVTTEFDDLYGTSHHDEALKYEGWRCRLQELPRLLLIVAD